MLVSLFFFLSGAAALILQILWMRMLGHVFGASALAVSTTLTAFMGGLALGAHLGGRIAPKLKRPLLVFSVLETSVGLYGLLVPGLLSLMPAAQSFIGTDLGIGFIGYSVIRFVLVAIILLLPTTAMGATLPILAEGVVELDVEVSSRVAELYAANTFGAVFGSLLAGFVLIPGVGIAKTVLIAAAIDLGVALAVYLLAQRPGGESRLVRDHTRRPAERILHDLDPAEVEDKGPLAERATLAAFAISGGAAMILEVLWTRSVGVVIGASIHAFTLILATFLIGLSLGSAIISRWVDRMRNPVRALATVEVAIGVLAFFGSLLIDRLPLWLLEEAKRRGATMNAILISEFLMSAVVMLPATLALGAVLPLVLRILAPKGLDHAGPLVGRAYTLNTIGAIVGSFLGGFVVLPTLGVELGLRAAAMTSASVGVLLALVRRPIAKGPLVAALALGLVLVVAPRWNVMRWTAGLFRFSLAKYAYARGYKASGQILFHEDGIASTVTVEAQEDGTGVALRVNGKVDASDEGDMPTQVLSGVLPLLVHEDAKRVMVIGFGSGVTSGAVLEKPGIESLRLVEIERAVFEASTKHFAHVNRRPGDDPRFHPAIDDGRNFLLTRPDRYDVIISEPSNPWMTGASSLFTQDFWSIAKRRMNPGGVFLQWVQLYELSAENIKAMFRTFGSVFPYVLVFGAGPSSNDTLVIGSDRPIGLDRAAIERALADPKLGPELHRAGIEVPEDFFGLLLLGRPELDAFAGQGPLNTDDNAWIEFRAPLDLLEYADKDADLPFLRDVEGKRLELIPKYMTGFDLESPGALIGATERLIRQGQLLDARAFLKRAEPSADGELRPRLRRARAQIGRFLEDDREPVVVTDKKVLEDPDYARAVAEMFRGDEDTAFVIVDHARRFEDRGSGQSFLYAYLLYRHGRTREAEYIMDDVLADAAFLEKHPSVYYYSGRILMERGKYDQGAAQMAKFLDRTKSSTAAEGLKVTRTSTAP